MIRKGMLAVLLLIGASAPGRASPAGIVDKVAPYVGPLNKLLPLVLDPGEVSSRGSAKAVTLHSEGQTKLIVSTSTVQVTVRKTHEKWTGDYHLKMTIPCKVSYAIDLGSAGSAAAAWDPGRKLLKVKAPPVAIYAIEPQLAHRQFSFKRTGIRWSNAGVEAQLKEAALEEVEGEARRHAAAELDSYRSQGADRLRHLLESKLRLVASDVRIMVE
jgi:hypothetical protein